MNLINARFFWQEPYQLSKYVISGGYSDGGWLAAQSSMHEALITGHLFSGRQPEFKTGSKPKQRRSLFGCLSFDRRFKNVISASYTKDI